MVVLENIVLVLRTCRECGVRKPLQHFLLYSGRVPVVVGDVKVCAACRAHRWDRIRKTPRRLGRYLDLPLDDWATASERTEA